MDKKVEKKIEKKIEAKVEKRVERKVEKEMKKKLRHILYERAKKGSSEFKNEFKRQLLTAVSAAFGLLIALSWREPISDAITVIVNKLGVGESILFYKFVSAVVVTLIAVVFLVVIARWGAKKE